MCIVDCDLDVLVMKTDVNIDNNTDTNIDVDVQDNVIDSILMIVDIL